MIKIEKGLLRVPVVALERMLEEARPNAARLNVRRAACCCDGGEGQVPCERARRNGLATSIAEIGLLNPERPPKAVPNQKE
jgi:hypothetical protein